MSVPSYFALDNWKRMHEGADAALIEKETRTPVAQMTSRYDSP